MMKKLLQHMLTFRFIVSFLALLSLLLIWLWGELLGLATRDARYLASIVVFSVWVLLLVGHIVGRSAQQTWRQWAEQRRQEAAQRVPVPQEDPSYAFLRERLLAAIHTLKTSSLGRRWLPFGGPVVYRMPWVVMMGPGQSGRTALMGGSDLDFALLEYSPYQENRDPGYDGCEWNFANQAVVMDTHGRISESTEGRPEWRNLLRLLKKYRRKKPLDALVLSVNVAELALADATAIDALAKQLRDRIHDLADQIGFQVPVYLVFTQVDRLEGFEAFFHGANVKELQKPWGAMLSWKRRRKATAAQAFSSEFDLLASELREMAEQRLLQQRGVGERLGLYSFPIEFAKLKPALGVFVGKLFQTNPYQFRPLFRGFYFSSVAQGGALVSPAGTQIRAAYGIADGGMRQHSGASGGAQRRYFVDEFFRCIVLPDRGLALRLPWRLERWQKWLLGGTFVLGALLAFSLAFSWFNNREAQQTLDHRMAQLAESLDSSSDPRDWLLRLDSLRAQAQALDEQAQFKPVGWRFGLYHGDDTRVAARKAFFGQLQQQMLKPVGRWLEGELGALKLPDPATLQARRAASAADLKRLAATAAQTEPEADPVEEGYTLFKVYTALAQPALADTGLMNRRLPEIWPQAVAGQLGAGTNSARRLNKAEQAALERCIAYYLSQLKAPDAAHYSASTAVVGQARDTLKSLVVELSPVRRLYKSIVDQAQSFPAITLAAVLGEPSDLLRGNAQVRGLYTRQAWEQFFRPAFEEASKKKLVSDNLLQQQGDEPRAATAVNSVAAEEGSEVSQASSQKIYEELKALYVEDYAQAWREFLGQIEVLPFASLDAAVAGLGRLGDLRSSPYVQLVQTLDEQTSWDAPTKPIFEEIAGQALGLKDRLLGKEPQKQRVLKGEQVIGHGRLEVLFAPLVSLVRSPDKGGQINQSLGRYLEQLQAVRNRLAKIRSGGAQGSAAVALVKNTLDGNGSEINDAFVWTDQLLAGMDYKTQGAVRSLFTQPILGSWDVLLTPAAVEINSAWSASVLEPWTRAFAGRYPFVDSAQDASLLELAKFVRDKDGVVWSFMRQNVDFLVTRQGKQLVPRQWAGRGLNVRADFLEALNRLVRVGEAIALHGEVGFRFYLQPEVNPRVAQTDLEIDGQTLRYQNGPADWKLMRWPGPSTAPQLKVQAVVQGPAVQGASAATSTATSAAMSAAMSAATSTGTAGNVQVAQFQRGTWAFMRALAAAQVERLDGDRARVSWPTASGQTVSYLMRNDASYGPQDLALIYGLQLPGQILQVQASAEAPRAPSAASRAAAPADHERAAQAQSRQAMVQQINQILALRDNTAAP